MNVIPYLASTVDFKNPMLLHMDLHLGNILFNLRNNPKLQSIID
jgi:hypothetical protein